MAELRVQTEACVIGRGEATEKSRPYVVLSAEHGLMTLYEIRNRGAGQAAIDLFDELWLGLASTNQGKTWFLREHRLLKRRGGLGRDYDTLRAASRIGGVLSGNPVQEEGGAAGLAALAARSLDALDSGGAPAIVYLKFLYSYARDEGLPVRAHWLEGLHPERRDCAHEILASPLATLAPSAALTKQTAELAALLEDFIRGHTDIRLPA